MQLSSPTRPRSRIDAMLPMMNVVLLLLMFLMLGGSAVLGDHDRATAPRSAHALPQQAPDVPVLHLDAAGVLRDGDGNPFDPAAMTVPAAGMLRLQADARAPGPTVVAVLQALQAAGVSRVQLAAVAR